MNALVKQAPPRPGEMLSVERARDLLAHAKKVDEVKKIRDQASAIRAYLRQQKASMEAQNDAAEIIVWSTVRMGELTKALTKNSQAEAGRQGGRGKKAGIKLKPALSKKAALQDLGLSKLEAARAEKLAGTSKAKIEAHIAGVRERQERLTMGGTVAAVSHGADYESDEWYTPSEIIEAVRKVLGEIDVDPASNVHAQKTVQAKEFYTPKDDGLKHEWRGRVFLNPPFSQPAVSEFVAGFIEEHEKKRMTAGIMLLNASTDTGWFHDLAARFPFCLTRGRIAFLQRDGKPIKGNRCGQVLFYAGKEVNKFREVFEKLGQTFERSE